MQGDGGEAQVAQHQGDALRVSAGAGEDHEGVAGKLVEDPYQVHILHHNVKRSIYTHNCKERFPSILYLSLTLGDGIAQWSEHLLSSS